MTTLIDRITKRIDELKKSTCTKSIVDELERVKAELTAVNGVDELIEKIINSIDVDWYDENWQSYSFSSTIRLELSKYIQDLKQTPVKDSQPNLSHNQIKD